MSNHRKRSSTQVRRQSSRTQPKPSHHQEPLTEQEFDTVCRVCMSSSAHRMVGLLDRHIQGMQLAEVLALIGAVEVPTEYDALPKWCCTVCLEGLEKAYQLRLLCQDSDRKLREVFSGVEAVVVKEEFDLYEINSIDEPVLDCKPEFPVLINVQEDTVSDKNVVPKEEMMEYGEMEEDQTVEENDAGGMDDMFEDCGEAESIGVYDEKVQVEQKTEQTNDRGVNPDVFDEVHASDGFRCCGCKIKFDSMRDLTAHSKAAHIDKTLSYKELQKRKQCDICFKVFKSASALQNHKQPVFQCPKCPKAYNLRRNLYRHMRSHTMPADKYKCNICGLCLTNSGNLTRHMLIHTGERPYKCPHCPASFTQDACLSRHKLIHSDERSHECPLCGKPFKSAVDVNRHVKHVHRDPKSFP